MNNPGAFTFLILFALTTLITYLAIRRRWTTIPLAATVGIFANVIFFILFSLAQGNVFLHALLVGVILGVVFTGMAAIMASFFRNNNPAGA
ncbi:MAG TPA: hypothetical protein PLD47_10885 [Aggregatilineales bacterium]|nr:hypothetical protein [Anaerolineales bacterium]HRE48220.1 hypothetical protein [Aggregatilineales bacterium]